MQEVTQISMQHTIHHPENINGQVLYVHISLSYRTVNYVTDFWPLSAHA